MSEDIFIFYFLAGLVAWGIFWLLTYDTKGLSKHMILRVFQSVLLICLLAAGWPIIVVSFLVSKWAVDSKYGKGTFAKSLEEQ